MSTEDRDFDDILSLTDIDLQLLKLGKKSAEVTNDEVIAFQRFRQEQRIDKVSVLNETVADVEASLEKMRDSGVSPDIETLNAMLARTKPEEASAVYDKLSQLGIKPNRNTFNIMLAKAAEDSAWAEMFLEGPANGFGITAKSHPEFSATAEDLPSAEVVLELMRANGVAPTSASYSILLRRNSSTYEELLDLLGLMRADNVDIGLDIYKRLMVKATLAQARDLLIRAQNEGLELDNEMYSLLNTKIHFAIWKYEDIKSWITTGDEAGLSARDSVPRSTWHRLIYQAPSYEEAKEFAQLMLNAGIKPCLGSFALLIARTTEASEAKFWLDKMHSFGIQGDRDLYTELLLKQSDHLEYFWQKARQDGARSGLGFVGESAYYDVDYRVDEHWADQDQPLGKVTSLWLATLEQDKIAPSLQTYKIALTACSEKEVDTLLCDLSDDEITPDAELYNIILARYRTWAVEDKPSSMMEVFDGMKAMGIKPDEMTYGELIVGSENYADVEQWLHEMEAAGLNPTFESLKKAILKAPSDVAKGWYDAMFALGFKADKEIQDSMFSRGDLRDVLGTRQNEKRVREIRAMLEEGESQTVEFKSSFGWDLHQKKQNKDLKMEIVQAVASFLNVEKGGQVLIGIEDDGTILGIEHDLKIHNGNKDKFTLGIEDFLKEKLSPNPLHKVVLEIVKVDDKEIAMLQVTRGAELTYVREASNKEQLYVRKGARSTELNSREAVTYGREWVRR